MHVVLVFFVRTSSVEEVIFGFQHILFRWGGRKVAHVMDGRSRMTVDPGRAAKAIWGTSLDFVALAPIGFGWHRAVFIRLREQSCWWGRVHLFVRDNTTTLIL